MSPASALGVRALPPQMSLSFPLSGRRGVRREAAGVEPQCPSDPIPHRPQMYYPSNSTLIQASVEVRERSSLTLGARTLPPQFSLSVPLNKASVEEDLLCAHSCL